MKTETIYLISLVVVGIIALISLYGMDYRINTLEGEIENYFLRTEDFSLDHVCEENSKWTDKTGWWLQGSGIISLCRGTENMSSICHMITEEVSLNR